MISKAKTYLVKMRLASPSTFPPCAALAVPSPLKLFRDAWAMPAISSTPKPSPHPAASQRWPLRVSFSESAAVTPTSMTTKRNSIMIAPV